MKKNERENTKKGRKGLKAILVLVSILIAIIFVYTIRNFMIVSKLQNNISEYINSTNYHIKSISTQTDGAILTMEYYKKDNKEVLRLTRSLNGEMTRITSYNNGERIDTFAESKDSKTIRLNNEVIMNINIINYLETDNNAQALIGSMMSNIKSIKYNGKECYEIRGFMSPSIFYTDKSVAIIEKDTGLTLKITAGGTSNTKEYEFNNVDDSIFVEPDISEYTLMEN